MIIISDQVLENQIKEEQFVTFYVGDILVAVKLVFVKMIQLLNELIPIPRSPSYILGVSNLENAIIPIIDLDVLLSVREMDIFENAIAIILSLQESEFAIYSKQLPKVQILEIATELSTITYKYIPENWVVGYCKENGSNIPILSPNYFWGGLGSKDIDITNSVELEGASKPDLIVDVEKQAAEPSEPKKKNKAISDSNNSTSEDGKDVRSKKNKKIKSKDVSSETSTGSDSKKKSGRKKKNKRENVEEETKE